MKAVAYRKSLPIDHADSLIDIELPAPQAQGRDLLVEVKAISVVYSAGVIVVRLVELKRDLR